MLLKFFSFFSSTGIRCMLSSADGTLHLSPNNAAVFNPASIEGEWFVCAIVKNTFFNWKINQSLKRIVCFKWNIIKVSKEKFWKIVYKKNGSQYCGFWNRNLVFFQTITCFHSTTKQCIIWCRGYEITYYVNGALLTGHINAINESRF